MRTIIINDIEYEFNCVYGVIKGINENIGIHLQLQVFKDGKQLDKKDIKGYAGEKIEEYICELVND